MENKELFSDKTEQILRGLEKSYQRLIEFKRYKNSPLITIKNGTVVEIQPDKMLPTTVYRCSSEIVKGE